MKPITIEFTVKNGDDSFTEDSVTFATPEEMFDYILPPEHANTANPVADKRATLQMGIVLITAPLSTIVQISEEIIDRVGRGEISGDFLAAIHASS